MSPLAEYVQKLSHEDRHAIIKSYEQFEKDGFIGEEPIRVFARSAMQHLGIGDEMQIVTWMGHLANQCYRYYYHLYGG